MGQFLLEVQFRTHEFLCEADSVFDGIVEGTTMQCKMKETIKLRKVEPVRTGIKEKRLSKRERKSSKRVIIQII